MHSYARSAGTVGVALGLALVKEAASSLTLAHALLVAVTVLLLLDDVGYPVGRPVGYTVGCPVGYPVGCDQYGDITDGTVPVGLGLRKKY